MNSALKKRWETQAGRAFLENLSRLGRSGNGYKIEESPFGVVPETGRLDLRGLVLPERTELRRVTLQFADLTGAVMKHAWFELSTFIDVYFDHCSLQMLSEGSDTFEKCSFRSSNFRRASIGHGGSCFKACRFESADFTQAGFLRPEFDDCLFDSCTFGGIDFRASSFNRCEFRGEVRGVWFRGLYDISTFEQFANPRPNRMTSLSFKKAKLFDVTFSDGCDLSSVIPPDDGRHALFDRWPERIKFVFEQSRAWPEPCKTAGERFFRSHEAQPNRDGTFPKTQEWYLIGLDDLVNQFGKEAGARIWEALLSA